MTDDVTQKSGEQLNYKSAMTELETILRSLDEDDVDIDALTSQVQRAAELIEHCRGRIQSAKVQVEQVVAGLNEPDADSDADAEVSDDEQ